MVTKNLLDVAQMKKMSIIVAYMLKYITRVLVESVITIFSEGRIIFKKKNYFVARVRCYIY